MKAPAFWWRERPGLAGRSLSPIGAIYGAVAGARMRRPGTAPGVPVLCIGNLVAGGAGKTPAAIALARLLRAEGRRPAILSRGYGRRLTSGPPFRVEPERHGVDEAGDEPLLLARAAPTFVGVDRLAAAQAAIAAGADCLIMDDGLQNPALTKTWSLVVVDGAAGIGNGLCMPAGPLRAPLACQWPVVSSLCVVGTGDAGDGVAAVAERAGIAVTRARLVPDPAVIARWRGRRLFAFAGIGRPSKFFATLEEAGLSLAGSRAFGDHHAYSAAELASLTRAAAGALLVTTSKDSVRLPHSFPAEALPVDLVFEDPARVRQSIPISR